MYRFKIWRLNRKARFIRDSMEQLQIEKIVLGLYDLEVRYIDDDPQSTTMSLQEFRKSTPTKKFLHRVFGNYTPGALCD